MPGHRDLKFAPGGSMSKWEGEGYVDWDAAATPSRQSLDMQALLRGKGRGVGCHNSYGEVYCRARCIAEPKHLPCVRGGRLDLGMPDVCCGS
jgi:hypothetical protein